MLPVAEFPRIQRLSHTNRWSSEFLGIQLPGSTYTACGIESARRFDAIVKYFSGYRSIPHGQNEQEKI